VLKKSASGILLTSEKKNVRSKKEEKSAKREKREGKAKAFLPSFSLLHYRSRIFSRPPHLCTAS